MVKILNKLNDIDNSINLWFVWTRTENYEMHLYKQKIDSLLQKLGPYLTKLSEIFIFFLSKFCLCRRESTRPDKNIYIKNNLFFIFLEISVQEVGLRAMFPCPFKGFRAPANKIEANGSNFKAEYYFHE